MEEMKRWERILSLPGDTRMWDMSTGQIYRVEMFVPVYDDRYQSVVRSFKLKGTQDKVVVAHLRLMGDKQTCSLVPKQEKVRKKPKGES